MVLSQVYKLPHNQALFFVIVYTSSSLDNKAVVYINHLLLTVTKEGTDALIWVVSLNYCKAYDSAGLCCEMMRLTQRVCVQDAVHSTETEQRR